MAVALFVPGKKCTYSTRTLRVQFSLRAQIGIIGHMPGPQRHPRSLYVEGAVLEFFEAAKHTQLSGHAGMRARTKPIP